MLSMFARGEKDGKPVRLVLFGLSHGNLSGLRDGKPIIFNGAAAGLEEDIEFMIFAGESEQTMQRDFCELIGPETEVHIDLRLKD
jgi:hypothetical protein